MSLKRMLLSPDSTSDKTDVDTLRLNHKFRQRVVSVLAKTPDNVEDVEVHVRFNKEDFDSLECRHATNPNFISNAIGIRPVSVSFLPEDANHRRKMVVACSRKQLEDFMHVQIPDAVDENGGTASISPMCAAPSVA